MEPKRSSNSALIDSTLRISSTLFACSRTLISCTNSRYSLHFTCPCEPPTFCIASFIIQSSHTKLERTFLQCLPHFRVCISIIQSSHTKLERTFLQCLPHFRVCISLLNSRKLHEALHWLITIPNLLVTVLKFLCFIIFIFNY